MRSPLRSFAGASLLGAILVPVVAGVALAHPLGNFTINHYAGIRVEPSRVLLDVVIDEAEIPTFQARQAFDSDADGVLSAAELSAARASGCDSVGRDLSLAIAGSPVPLSLVEAGIAFPPGNAGLSTLRLVCTFDAALGAAITAGTPISFRDDFEASRIGWREVTVVGSGVTVDAAGRAVGERHEPADVVPHRADRGARRAVRCVRGLAGWGGAARPRRPGRDARSVPRSRLPSAAAPIPRPVATSAAPPSSVGAATPSGEASIPDVLRAAPATPLIGLIALLTAAVLGAGHALTPGHGKTLMAAYLVGTRGTPRHAVGLGMAVSVSHTLGILGLAAVVLAAESTLPPDLVVRVAPLVAAVSIVLIGGWMLLVEVRRGFAARTGSGSRGLARPRPSPSA